ncbi:MAG: RNA polymerase factor sigma-54 [Hyphomicrobiaceae bacterium]|nr:RNA polymerase factor sigma-54 [Hyphomicrobiaceae bacterium]
MALLAKMELRQGQQLVMTPQLQQAIKLLQFSNIELAAFVEAELERNPLLERDDQDVTSKAYIENDEANTDHEGLDSRDFDICRESTVLDRPSSEAHTTTLSQLTNSRKNNNFEQHDSNIESYVSINMSLREHLHNHMQLCLTDPGDSIIAIHIIDMVDDAGYIVGDLSETAIKLGVTYERLERVLRLLQTAEPAGIPARNLAECLRLQLQERNRFDPLIGAVLENLPLLATHKLAELRRVVNVSMDELTEMIAELKSLNPKPGYSFDATPMQPVVADVIVSSAANNGWAVELNSETLPRVLVDRTYYATVSRCVKSNGEKSYLQECFQTANWLVKSLDQRARTILRVSQEIVRQQDGFFAHGVQHLRPLNLKTIAEAISMHESTISRVTSNKYMSTPRGVFELKYFFSSAIASSDEDGDVYSSEAVRCRIKTMIDNESQNAILSDDKIVELLKQNGIDIARRTVAKYRDLMRIPSSVQRRREKRLRF